MLLISRWTPLVQSKPLRSMRSAYFRVSNMNFEFAAMSKEQSGVAGVEREAFIDRENLASIARCGSVLGEKSDHSSQLTPSFRRSISPPLIRHKQGAMYEAET